MPLIRFIDPSFTRHNPSTQGLVDVAVGLAARGWEVEVFACDLAPCLVGAVVHRKVPSIRLPFGWSVWLYFFYYHWHGLIDYFSGAFSKSSFLTQPASSSSPPM